MELSLFFLTLLLTAAENFYGKLSLFVSLLTLQI